jgi:hypothetical protein
VWICLHFDSHDFGNCVARPNRSLETKRGIAMHNEWMFLGTYAEVCTLNVNGNYLDNTLDKALDLIE